MMHASDFVVVIPARFASSRLPGKPLLDLGGLPMIVRVAQAALASSAREVVIATDDQRIADVATAHQLNVCFTDSKHQSGTERLAEVVAQKNWADDLIVVNLQGDEPFMPPAWLTRVANLLAAQSECSMATCAHPIYQAEEIANPNIVKVVLNAKQQALYFSRAPMPYLRDSWASLDQITHVSEPCVFRHIGLYAYRAAFLRQFPLLAVSPLETLEMLEQLRVLWHGYKIAVDVCESAPMGGIDTTADLLRAQTWYTQNK